MQKNPCTWNNRDSFINPSTSYSKIELNKIQELEGCLNYLYLLISIPIQAQQSIKFVTIKQEGTLTFQMRSEKQQHIPFVSGMPDKLDQP